MRGGMANQLGEHALAMEPIFLRTFRDVRDQCETLACGYPGCRSRAYSESRSVDRKRSSFMTSMGTPSKFAFGPVGSPNEPSSENLRT